MPLLRIHGAEPESDVANAVSFTNQRIEGSARRLRLAPDQRGLSVAVHDRVAHDMYPLAFASGERLLEPAECDACFGLWFYNMVLHSRHSPSRPPLSRAPIGAHEQWVGN